MKSALIGLALFAGSLALNLRGGGQPLANGDEAVYAEMAREMAGGAGIWTLSWQNRPVLNRPPVAVWPLALAARAASPSERVLRTPVAVFSALAVVLLFFFGAERHGIVVGTTAALLLAAADRWILYSRYI